MPPKFSQMTIRHTNASKAVCVIGWPVEHSRSPLIHNHWIKELGLAAEYRREGVPPEKFADFVSRLAEHGYAGANVTVPHKEAALRLSDPDARATAVSAANTLWLDGGVLRSTNTDGEGFIGNLDATVPGWERDASSAVVLGAGGAARSIVYGLIERGVEQVHVVNRSLERAAALRAQFGERVHPRRWEETEALLPSAGLLVNTTTVGMAGQPALVLDLARLPAQAVVSDIVYVPLETALLRAARARGLRSVDGLGMLLHQAVGGFARWFGVRPRVTEALRALVEADLARK
ncbi:MAG: shikimate dehydrogenase [Alphaproteobacteria bacterium]|jgi:shikimate dehydrogenase|nr:shikimate dehydrogenase [Alphaproteobacteria bacterium]